MKNTESKQSKKELQTRRNINLCDELANKAKKISLAKDNVSEVIRISLQEYKL